MFRQNLFSKRTFTLAGIGSVLLGYSIAPAASAQGYSAQSYPLLNPCPQIYYEEPFNSTRIVPSGCPPNAATQQTQQLSQTQLPQTQLSQTGTQVGVQGSPIPNHTAPFGSAPSAQPSLPEGEANAAATIALVNSSFDVRLTNNTNVPIAYEVIGQTEQRYLQGGEEILLQGIPAPATVTFVRQDNGFVEVVPLSAESGLLNVTLNEDTSLSDQNQGVLQIQENGQVFLN